MRPTVLFTAQHRNGMKYLGKTYRLDLLHSGRYTGSGPTWLEYKQEHGDDVRITSISEVFTDPDELEELARFISEELDVVSSAEWMNRKVETGIDGGSDPESYTPEVRSQMSEKAKARSTPATAAHLNTPEAALKKRKPKSKLPAKKECTHCGDTFRPNTITRHEAACHFNPANIRHCDVCDTLLTNDYRATTCSRRCRSIKRGQTNGD